MITLPLTRNEQVCDEVVQVALLLASIRQGAVRQAVAILVVMVTVAPVLIFAGVQPLVVAVVTAVVAQLLFGYGFRLLERSVCEQTRIVEECLYPIQSCIMVNNSGGSLVILTTEDEKFEISCGTSPQSRAFMMGLSVYHNLRPFKTTPYCLPDEVVIDVRASVFNQHYTLKGRAVASLNGEIDLDALIRRYPQGLTIERLKFELGEAARRAVQDRARQSQPNTLVERVGSLQLGMWPYTADFPVSPSLITNPRAAR